MIKHYKVTPRSISRILLTIVLLLLLANLVCIFGNRYFGFSFHTMDQFYFNTEGNLPTVYSFLLLCLCSVMLWIVSGMPGEGEKKKRIYWRMLSALFLFLAVDELISIHETFSDNAEAAFDAAGKGYLYFAWVVPYVLIFGVLFILLLRFFIGLPRQTKTLFAVAACTYLMGAVGFEMIGGNYIFVQGEEAKQSLSYMLMVTIEELLEMIGLIVFIHALLEYYIAHHPDQSFIVELTFRD